MIYGVFKESFKNLKVDYYPFGLKHKGYNNQIIGRDHQYGYNGIEESNELGNNMLEMDLRQYDPAIARWVVLDPVTHHEYSPYQAFDNNPIFFADPSGADSETDMWGRNRFDSFGMYIAPNDRGEKNYEHTNEKTKNSTYQISEKVNVSQSVVFFPEREGDNRGDQLIETKINTIKRFSQDKKIIETNETIVYSTLINDDYIILSNKKFNATTINMYGQGGKKEKTIERPIMDVNVDAAQMFEEQAKFIDKTINTSREYNKAIPILVQEFNSRALDRYGNGVSFSIPFFKSFRIIPTVAAIKSLALEIRSLKPSSIKAQYRYSSTRATMLRKVERIKF